ncbi:MAG TPA: radical SAM protein [Anaeromyxobacteraceae bacterium]|nr:radical SAM protein [Anaeromyxobacteraceae bacterium]
MTGFGAVRAAAVRGSVPLTVHLELTAACNARCSHCFQGEAHAASPRELSLPEWIAVVDQARAAGAMFLTLSGGEALLSPHFWAIAERARAVGLALRLLTNGLALGRGAVRRLAALRPASVEVTVFSLRAERHDAVTRVPGSLRRTIRGLLRLKRARVPTVLKCPLLAGTAEDQGAVRRLAARLGAGILFDPGIYPAVDGDPAPTRCRGDDAALQRFFADPATLAHDAPRSGTRQPAGPPCGMARTFAVVSAEGDVFACPVLRTPAGNVRRAPLCLVWRAPLMERLRARRFGDLAVCGTCARSGYCGRCSAMALLEDGDLDGPSSRACHLAELRERAWGRPPPPGVPAPRLRVLPGP